MSRGKVREGGLAIVLLSEQNFAARRHVVKKLSGKNACTQAQASIHCTCYDLNPTLHTQISSHPMPCAR